MTQVDLRAKPAAAAGGLSEYVAIPVDYALGLQADAVWRSGPFPTLSFRDLLLHDASAGQMSSIEIRAEAEGAAERWFPVSPIFSFVYLIAGELSFEGPDGANLTLKQGDTAQQAALVQGWRVRWTRNLRLVEITTGRRGGERVAHPAPLLDFPAPGPLAGPSQAVHLVSRNVPENFEVGKGPRKFLSYRDFLAAESTNRRIHIHQIDAIDTPEGGTGWHIHSMSQLFYVTRGWVDIAVEKHGTTRMLAGDVMCIGFGTMHNVFRFSPDYSLIELCLPADYSTEARPAPQEKID